MKTRTQVTAFVDWNAQIHTSGLDAKADPIGVAESVLRKTARRIAKCLISADSERNFNVTLRLYHGWYKGFEPSVNRKAIRAVLAQADLFLGLSPHPDVLFNENVQFGDRLIAALSARLHANLAIHLPNTLRTQNGSLQEKMVDTALASDVVVSAFTDPEDWIVVVAEDDDLVPPVFVAESLVNPRGGRVLLLHSRHRSKNFLNLESLAVRSI